MIVQPSAKSGNGELQESQIGMETSVFDEYLKTVLMFWISLTRKSEERSASKMSKSVLHNILVNLCIHNLSTF